MDGAEGGRTPPFRYGRCGVKGAERGQRVLGDETEQLIDGECDHPEQQMSHDFAGPSEVDETATKLVLPAPVQLLDDGAFLEALLLFFR